MKFLYWLKPKSKKFGNLQNAKILPKKSLSEKYFQETTIFINGRFALIIQKFHVNSYKTITLLVLTWNIKTMISLMNIPYITCLYQRIRMKTPVSFGDIIVPQLAIELPMGFLKLRLFFSRISCFEALHCKAGGFLQKLHWNGPFSDVPSK